MERSPEVDAELLHPTVQEEDFELDVTFADNGTALAELMNSTSDNCGGTGASACVTCAVS